MLVCEASIEVVPNHKERMFSQLKGPSIKPMQHGLMLQGLPHQTNGQAPALMSVHHRRKYHIIRSSCLAFGRSVSTELYSHSDAYKICIEVRIK